MGKGGSRVYLQDKMIEETAFVSTRTIETTSAGDTFMGCVLHFICQMGIDNLEDEKLHQMLRFANAAASLVTERKGALRVMPEEAEVLARLNL